ncbi:CynX/NimT family MFS transporter [Bordetella flabilis]|uniref:MFS transporter n=1 Tax=Bordetella flabilis TaxID=463014 RepID=A0A193GE97_9BORD|nr:MFS transporter [Bordetella flabilis]ANN78362.1 MFS transporter [Bordetella flabilis]
MSNTLMNRMYGPWPSILLIVGAGIVSAFQVGKAPMAMSAVQGDLDLSLAAASWLLSSFAIVGAIAGVPIGLAVDHVGARRMAVVGLLLQGVGSLLGGLAPDAFALLATRVLEGMGFLCLIVAAPTLVAAVAPVAVRGRAMALWATFMPMGMTLIFLAAPSLDMLGWRGFWHMNAAIPLAYAALLLWGLRLPPQADIPARRSIGRDVRDAFVARDPWILGGLFMFFSAAYFALFGFLPTLVSGWFSVGNQAASMLSAIAVAASAGGNILGGQLLVRGVSGHRLLRGAFGGMALCSLSIFGILGGATPPLIAYVLCIVYSLLGGLIPTVIFDYAPRYAPRPQLVGATVGFAMQGNNVGLIVGPACAGAIAATFGWPAVSLLVLAMAAGALVLVFALESPRIPARG